MMRKRQLKAFCLLILGLLGVFFTPLVSQSCAVSNTSHSINLNNPTNFACPLQAKMRDNTPGKSCCCCPKLLSKLSGEQEGPQAAVHNSSPNSCPCQMNSGTPQDEKNLVMIASSESINLTIFPVFEMQVPQTSLFTSVSLATDTQTPQSLPRGPDSGRAPPIFS